MRYRKVALLDVLDLETQFTTPGGAVRAVDGVSFHVEAGETLALVGESGCGKSVTARSIMRLVNPPGRIVGGQVRYDGRDLLTLDSASMRAVRGREVAMIFQDPMASLNPVKTIGDQVAEPIRLHLKLDRAATRDRTVESLRMVGIPSPEKRLRAYPHEFSGGMRQRVMIAMALSCKPKLVLADEVTTALDVTIQAQVLDLLDDLKRQFGVAFLFITHDLGIVARFADRVHIMYAGQIVEKASTRELFANPRMPYTWGLLRSVPRLDEERKTTLKAIEGGPPDLSTTITGCRFESRCQYRRPICRARNPELISISSEVADHEARCWGTQRVPEGGWLIDHDWRAEAAPMAPGARVPDPPTAVGGTAQSA